MLTLKQCLSVLCFALFSLSVHAQSITVRGTVVDQNNEPIIGAVVKILNSNRGTSTTIEGTFELQALQNDVLEVSCLGYASTEVPVAGRTNIIVKLDEDVETLEETVVIGYGVQKKSDVSGSISSVKAEQIENYAVETIGQALQGKVAGAQIITSSGAPGSSSTIRIRGYSSNNSGSTAPLYIVDGLKVSDINYLDASSIESIEILKDAASAAIYGAEAGNGVVLITTVKGRAGRSRAFYNMSYSISSLANKADVMDAQQYYDFQTVNGFATSVKQWDGVTNTDWQDAVYENGQLQHHTVGFEGGNDKGTFFTSLSYMNNNGMIVGDKDYSQRFSGQLNGSYKINKWIKAEANVSISQSKSNSVSTSSDQGENVTGAYRMDPLTPVEYISGGLPSHVTNALADGFTIITNPLTGNHYGISAVQVDAVNPFVSLYRYDSSSERLRINGSGAVNLTPIKGFTFVSRLGIRYNASAGNSYTSPYYASSVNSSTSYSVGANNSYSSYYQWENFATYNTEFGKHEITAMAGMSYQQSFSQSLSASVNAINNVHMENYRYISNATSDATKTLSGGTPSTSSQIGYFGRLSWNYDDRYNIQAVLRADAYDSSKLSRTNRWGFFPSISGSWTITNEDFIKSNISKDKLSFAKLRVSYGKNGNINVLSGYPYVVNFTTSSGTMYPLDGEFIARTTLGSSIANANLSWETSTQLDLGLDMRFLSDRLSITTDFYNKNTEDLLVNTTPPLITGASSMYKNVGRVNNNGLELEVGWRDTKGDFRYDISANIATLRNKVMDLGGAARQEGAKIHLTTATYFEEGYPVWYFYGYNYLGVDQSGNAIYEDRDGDGEITTEDRGYIGDAIPDFTYGLSINLAWKGLDLLISGSGSQGGDIWYVMNRSQLNLFQTYWTDSYSVKGSGAKYPIPNNLTNDKFAFSTAAIYDGSYFKIRQFQLGYTLPRDWTRKLGVSSLRGYVSLDNFFTFSSYPGMDPETSAGTGSSMGLDKGGYPVAKSATLGINLSF